MVFNGTANYEFFTKQDLPASFRNKSFKRLGNQKFAVNLKDYDVFPQVCMDVVKSSSLILCEKMPA